MVSLRKMEKMEALSFDNSLRLHKDSILLFKSKSYPSAYFLSVIALEELGKMLSLNNYIFQECAHSKKERRSLYQDSEMRKFEQEYFDLLHGNHVWKQLSFFSYTWENMQDLKFLDNIKSRKLEKEKQGSLYVGLKKKNRSTILDSRVHSPLKIGRSEVINQITRVNDFFVIFSIGKLLGFYGVDNKLITRQIRLSFYKDLTNNWTRLGVRARTRINAWTRYSKKERLPYELRKKISLLGI